MCGGGDDEKESYSLRYPYSTVCVEPLLFVIPNVKVFAVDVTGEVVIIVFDVPTICVGIEVSTNAFPRR